jgi:osmotically-inducible protein OsmY
MKALTFKRITCITALILAPSIAFAGGTNSVVQDKAATGHSNDTDTGTKAGQMRADSPSDGKVDDVSIANNVSAALKADSVTSELDIKVTVRSGIATLTGDAAGTRWKTRAEVVAAGVKGVKSVKNDIKIGS